MISHTCPQLPQLMSLYLQKCVPFHLIRTDQPMQLVMRFFVERRDSVDNQSMYMIMRIRNERERVDVRIRGDISQCAIIFVSLESGARPREPFMCISDDACCLQRKSTCSVVCLLKKLFHRRSRTFDTTSKETPSGGEGGRSGSTRLRVINALYAAAGLAFSSHLVLFLSRALCAPCASRERESKTGDTSLFTCTSIRLFTSLCSSLLSPSLYHAQNWLRFIDTTPKQSLSRCCCCCCYRLMPGNVCSPANKRSTIKQEMTSNDKVLRW